MPKLLVIGYVWPEPNSSAAGTRMMQLLEFFKSEDYQIIFATTARETAHMADLDDHGICTEKIKLNDPGFDVFLQGLMPDVVLFDRFMMEEQFGWRLDKICPNAIKILDTEDLHFLRDARRLAYKNTCKPEDYYMDSDLAKREISAIYRCDLSLIISENELELLTSVFKVPKHILVYLPFLLDTIGNSKKNNLPHFKERKDFISIGNFLHEPNWNAVLYLKEKIWPLLRKKLPGVKMQVYGAYPSQKVLNLHNPEENFIINGRADSAEKVMQNARVCLAPIQFGAGLKGKLVEAMLNGTGSITTELGAEGINAEKKWNGFICTSDNDFIEKANLLYTDEKIWQEKQHSGFKIINSRFDKESHICNFRKSLIDVKLHLQLHRSSNFTGKMLKYHLHKSTYYMSRFIEEKNRNKQ